MVAQLCTIGNEVCDDLTETSIAETTKSGLGEVISEAHLRVGKARDYPRSYPTGRLALTRTS
jgi:hypothetical protein